MASPATGQPLPEVESHRRFDELVEEAKTGKGILGTAANTTKVLSSGKVLGKPIPSPAKQEWMQRRNNRYQRDKNGHIIEACNDKEDVKLKGKAKDDTIATKNSFDVLEVEDSGKEENKGNSQEQATGIKSSSATVNPSLLETRVGDYQQPNTGRISGAPTERGSSGKSTEEALAKIQDNAKINPRGAVEVLATVEGDPVEVSGNAQMENVPTKVINDTLRSDQETVDGKLVDLNGTIIPALHATVNPNWSSIYELQFKLI
ncbi:hypothetical protein A4A49_28131 [Nicotiana attenuata]|uniref:Uncharacterized protein n=1 Tax=Nicotiana attenuata TaxID=49451 RepID=A0A314KV74_NICAT|nr:hypothetical protein A4A49_28131 [Nicotiana attenuata]